MFRPFEEQFHIRVCSVLQPNFQTWLPHQLQQCHDLGGQLGTAVYRCLAPPARNALPESCNTQVRVSKWHYVGGAFGACSTEEMQRELWENGPLAASIEPSGMFRPTLRSLEVDRASFKTNKAEVMGINTPHRALGGAMGCIGM